MSIHVYLKRITNTALAILLAAGTLFCAAACQTDPPSLATVASNTSLTVTPSKTTTTATNSTTTARASKTTRQTTATRPLEVLKHGDVMWEELPFQKSKTGFWDQTDTWFDLRREITHAEYVFSGKVISCREYVSSRSQKYETVPDWKKNVIIEVKIDQVYHGNPPDKGGIIKIYYEGQIRSPLAHSAVILEQKDYVFVTQSLGYYAEKYPEVAAFTDVYLDTYYKFSVFPIENGDVLAYTGYFDWNSELMKKVKPQRKTDLIAHGTTGGYAVMAEKDFEEAFLSLFKNPETLPTAPNFWEPPPETTRSTDVSQKKIKEDYVAFLKRRYSNSSEYQNLQTSKVFIRRVVGTYGDVTVLFIDKGGMFYTQAVSYAAVDGITFRFPDSQQLLVYKEGDFDTLNGAFERGWIDRQDLIVIHRDLYVGVGMEEPDLTMPIPERFTTTATTPPTTTTAPNETQGVANRRRPVFRLDTFTFPAGKPRGRRCLPVAR